MPNEDKLSNEKSLAIIHEMINQAKTNFTDSGIGWLIWGTIIFLASVSTYIFIDIGAKDIYLGWNILGIITIPLLLIDIFRPRKAMVRTYVDEILKFVNIGFAICMFTIVFAINVAVDPNSGFGFFPMIFAFLMLVKGRALKARSLMVGAAVNWIGAIAMFVNKDFKYDMLIMAAAVLIGYIIPGLLLRSQYRKMKENAKK